MNITIYPNEKYPSCVLLVGGSGDTDEGFLPLVKLLNQKLPAINICTFTFSSQSETKSILDIQADELIEVIEKLANKHGYTSIDIIAVSMGAYATIKLLSSSKYSHLIRKAIFFDPADYYLSAKFGDSSDVTWSGSQLYKPAGEVVSTGLKDVSGKVKITVVHLTLRNYGVSGYLKEEYAARGEDIPNGYPRLSRAMVKGLYDKVPSANKGKYLEVGGVPHAILRDGNISRNIEKTVDVICQLLSKTD